MEKKTWFVEKKPYKFSWTISSVKFLNLVRDQTLFEHQAKNKDFENSCQSNLIHTIIYLEFFLSHQVYYVRLKFIQKK